LENYVNSNKNDFQTPVLDLVRQLLLTRFNYSLLNVDELRCISNLLFYFNSHFFNHIINHVVINEETLAVYGALLHFVYPIVKFILILSTYRFYFE
ncbi:unnamed protein product, partial [Rotaria sp. Silwood1]